MLLGPGRLQEDPQGLAPVGLDLTRPCRPQYSADKIESIISKVRTGRVYEIKFDQSFSGR